eukprot:TRINITY_DN2593_c0_g1_i3.p1 TRINITY_DN2593_c0_g1~~TRINITY_DN2593_c0_g1_i3.p1  ORF type:complete len:162 (-),score=11.88 TRINITY_DN2593_c0_g1_i3:720-1205(-)
MNVVRYSSPKHQICITNSWSRCSLPNLYNRTYLEEPRGQSNEINHENNTERRLNCRQQFSERVHLHQYMKMRTEDIQLREKLSVIRSKRYKNMKNKMSDYYKAYNAENRERGLLRRKTYYQSNKQKVILFAKQYYNGTPKIIRKEVSTTEKIMFLGKNSKF